MAFGGPGLAPRRRDAQRVGAHAVRGSPRCSRRPRATASGCGAPAPADLVALRSVYGDEADAYARWQHANLLSSTPAPSIAHLPGQLVYGEADLSLLSRALDVVSPAPGAHFVDVGSGCGRAVLAAALLRPTLARVSGVEVVRGLHDDAVARWERLRNHVSVRPNVRFLCADYAADEAAPVIQDADVAFCFCTTWGDPGEPEATVLSKALRGRMRAGAKAVVVDKRLCERDGWRLLHAFDAPNADTGESTVSVYQLES